MKDLTNKFVVTNRQIEVNTDELEEILTGAFALGKDALFSWGDDGVSIADRTEEDV